MLRKFFAAVLLTSFVACGAVFAGTEAELQEQAMAEAMAAMASEPPLTQADIDAFLAMAPKVDEVMHNQDAILKLYEDDNMNPQRFGFVGGRISVGILKAQGITREQLEAVGQFPEFMFPNEAEVALINANLDRIVAILNPEE